jgi:peptidoglycan/xylan/chitin deacetylase (PgdA/CDA1 family)
LAGAALCAAFVVLLPALAAGGTPRGDARGVNHVHETPQPPAAAGDKVVALTFDDGPHPTYTPQVLDILARYGVRATFFQLGREAERHPDLVRRVVAEGHVVANHTWDHRDLRSLDEEAFAFQVDHTTQVLEAISGQRQLCVRPPMGRSDPGVTSRLAARAMASVVWTSDSRDFEKPGVPAIVDGALEGLQPGAIVLLHDGGGNRDQTIAALPTIIERILAEGYRIVPICQPDAHSPAGELSAAEGLEGGRVHAAGWGADPDAPDPMKVHLYVDDAFATEVLARSEGTPGPRFDATLRARPGDHQVCAYGINIGPGGANPSLGCASVEVPPLTPFDDLRLLAARLLYVQLRQERATVQRVALVHAGRRAPWEVELR